MSPDLTAHVAGRDDIHLAPGGRLQQCIELRALISTLGTANALVHILRDYLPAHALGNGASFIELVVCALAVC